MDKEIIGKLPKWFTESLKRDGYEVSIAHFLFAKEVTVGLGDTKMMNRITIENLFDTIVDLKTEVDKIYRAKSG